MTSPNSKSNHDVIYEEQADMYDLLVSREDESGSLRRALLDFGWSGKHVVELGAGTGRLSLMLAPLAGSITMLDASAAMLDVAARKMAAGPFSNWRTAVADHRHLPVETESADAVIAGWTVCYIASSNVEGWERHLEQTLSEMKRVLKPGGDIILIETLGTGTAEPAPPAFLIPYFRVLEESCGFTRRFVRTDFRFRSAEEAETLVRFFFGPALADRVRAEQTAHVPSCTGIWHWRKPSIGGLSQA